LAVTWPDLSDVKTWLTIDDAIDDGTLRVGMDAASATMTRSLRFPLSDEGDAESEYLPDDLALAFYLRVQRYLMRRNTALGVVGFGDFGAVRVARTDPDIEEIERKYRKPVFG
jgi:hypothetical protein